MPINREMYKDVLCDTMEYCCCLVKKSCLTLLWPDHPELYLTRLLCSWESPGKNSGVGCHFLHQGIFSTRGSNSCLFLGRQIFHHVPPGKEWSYLHSWVMRAFSGGTMANDSLPMQEMQKTWVLWVRKIS